MKPNKLFIYFAYLTILIAFQIDYSFSQTSFGIQYGWSRPLNGKFISDGVAMEDSITSIALNLYNGKSIVLFMEKKILNDIGFQINLQILQGKRQTIISNSFLQQSVNEYQGGGLRIEPLIAVSKGWKCFSLKSTTGPSFGIVNRVLNTDKVVIQPTNALYENTYSYSNPFSFGMTGSFGVQFVPIQTIPSLSIDTSFKMLISNIKTKSGELISWSNPLNSQPPQEIISLVSYPFTGYTLQISLNYELF